MRIELVFMVELLTFFASVALPLLCMVCQASRIFLSGIRLASYFGWVLSKIDLSAYFKMLMRLALVGHDPSAFGSVTVELPVLELVTRQSILPESSTEIMTLGRT